MMIATLSRRASAASLAMLLTVTYQPLNQASAQEQALPAGGQRQESQGSLPLGHDFGIDNGLVATSPAPDGGPARIPLASSVAAYTAEVHDPLSPHAQRRIELHWVSPDRIEPRLPDPPSPAGLTFLAPVLWEPDAQCMTPLRNPERHTAGSWSFAPAVETGAPANAQCRPMRRLGGLPGTDKIRVLIEALGDQIAYQIAVFPQGTGVAYQGELRPSERIAARADPGHFEEWTLFEYGFRQLEDVWLVTNSGIFKGVDGTGSAGTGGFTVIETTDLYRSFRPGDLFYKVHRSGVTPLQITLTRQERAGDGTQCPDTDGTPFVRDLRLSSLTRGVRTWVMDSRSPKPEGRHCVLTRINARTCQAMDCVQWSDTANDTLFDEIMILTDDVTRARQIFAHLPALTLANSGFKHDPATHSERVRTRERNGGGSGWDSCGPEGCETRRRREDMDNLLIDLWNR